VTAGGTDAALLQRIEAYFDAAPRAAADVEQHGPLTLFVSRIPWRYYGRPRMGLPPRDAVRAEDVRALRARQRDIGVREALEWVHETTPSLAEAAAAAGMAVQMVPLLAAPVDAIAAPAGVPGVTLRMLGADDAALVPSQDAVELAFGGVPGMTSEKSVAFLRARIANGLTGVGVAEAGGEVVGGGSHQPVGSVSEIMSVGVVPAERGRGIGSALIALLAGDARASGATLVLISAADDRVAALYERVGFRRVGTTCFGRAG
jgi:ribosomal protein S18 acetylase RimI-like enzyme